MKNYHNANTNIKLDDRHDQMRALVERLAEQFDIRLKPVFRNRSGGYAQPHFVDPGLADFKIRTAGKFEPCSSPDAIRKWEEETGHDLVFLLVFGSKVIDRFYFGGFIEYVTVEPYVLTGHLGMNALFSFICHEVAHALHIQRYGHTRGDVHNRKWLRIYKELLAYVKVNEDWIPADIDHENVEGFTPPDWGDKAVPWKPELKPNHIPTSQIDTIFSMDNLAIKADRWQEQQEVLKDLQ